MTTVNVIDADGVKTALEKPLAPGRASAAASRPVALSTEDKTAIDGLATLLTAIVGYVDGMEALEASIASKIDTTNAALAASGLAGGITSTARLLSSAASTNATVVKSSAGRLFGIVGYNAASAMRYLKLYNKGTTPTVGTDTPVMTIALPPRSYLVLDWPAGRAYATGIAFAITTGVADNDTGAVAAGDILGLNMDYL